jgi:hypothetical protein
VKQIKIFGSSLNYAHLNGGIDLLIPNTYKDLKAVYLVGRKEAPIMIWPEDRILRVLFFVACFYF